MEYLWKSATRKKFERRPFLDLWPHGTSNKQFPHGILKYANEVIHNDTNSYENMQTNSSTLSLLRNIFDASLSESKYCLRQNDSSSNEANKLTENRKRPATQRSQALK